MSPKLAATVLLAFAGALPAKADQFAVRLDAPYDGASARLLETLQITEIESFSQNGAHYLVIDAPNEAYVEAFILAIGDDAVELNVIDADWTNPVMRDLTTSQRLGFLRAIECKFCAG